MKGKGRQGKAKEQNESKGTETKGNGREWKRAEQKGK